MYIHVKEEYPGKIYDLLDIQTNAVQIVGVRLS